MCGVLPFYISYIVAFKGLAPLVRIVYDVIKTLAKLDLGQGLGMIDQSKKLENVPWDAPFHRACLFDLVHITVHTQIRIDKQDTFCNILTSGHI